MATPKTSSDEKKKEPETPTMHLCDNCYVQFKCGGSSLDPAGCKCLTGLYRTRADGWANTRLFFYCDTECMDQANDYETSEGEE